MRLLPHQDSDPVCVGGLTRSYGELARDVAALEDHLGPPVPGGERLVVCQGRYSFAVAMLACWARGEIARLPASLAPEALEAVAADVLGVLHDGETTVGVDVRPLLGMGSRSAELFAPAEDAVLVTLSTSGSTGHHRAHPKTARQLVGEARMLGARFEVGAGEVVLATIPPHHIYGLLFSVLMPLVRGGVCCENTPFFPAAVAAAIRDVGATTLVTVPAHLRAFATSDREAFAGLRLVFSSGAPLGARTATEMHSRHGLEITEVFGSTETGGIAWRRQTQGTTWAPLPQVHVSVGEDDALVVDSPFVPAGSCPYTADDRVRLCDGGFTHLGRRDDVVKIGSKRVSIGAVERALLDVEGVADAAVVAMAEGERTRLHAAVVSALEPAEIRVRIRAAVDSVAVPRIHIVDALPRSGNGKLPRQRVLDLLAGRELRVADRTVDGSVVSFDVHVPRDCRWFEGHFPDKAVLPGIAQLHELIIGEAQRAWPDLGAAVGIGRVRFQAPVMPGNVLRAEIRRDGDGVRFSIHREEVRCTMGVLRFGGST